MNLAGKVVVVTGAAQGIGAGLAERFAADGARAVVAADIKPGSGIFPCDVSREDDIVRLDDEYGRTGPGS